MSMRELGIIFGVHHREISSRISATRESLMKSTLVKNNVGFIHLSAKDIIDQHTTTYARTFFSGDKQPVVVLDGEFFYLNIICFS